GLLGGDIFHGALTLNQLFSARPMLGHADYRGPLKGLYHCGSGAHPGGGVTGAPGHNAARVILGDHRALFAAAALGLRSFRFKFQTAKLGSAVIASQRVGARRRPMTGSAKQSSFGATTRKMRAGTDELTMGLRSERGALPSPRAARGGEGSGVGGGSATSTPTWGMRGA